MKRTAGVVLLFGLVAAACGGGKGGSTGATVPVESSTTTTSIDVTKVPDVITVAYANAVMKALDHVLGDGLRSLAAAKVPTPDFYNRLKAVYDEPEFSREQSSFGDLAARGLENVRPVPGDPRTQVVKVIASSPQCAFLETERSLAAFFIDTPPAGTTHVFVGMKTKTEERDPAGLNPTTWAIVLDGTSVSGGTPKSPCA